MEQEIGDEAENINSKIMESLLGQVKNFGFYPEGFTLYWKVSIT